MHITGRVILKRGCELQKSTSILLNIGAEWKLSKPSAYNIIPSIKIIKTEPRVCLGFKARSDFRKHF